MACGRGVSCAVSCHWRQQKKSLQRTIGRMSQKNLPLTKQGTRSSGRARRAQRFQKQVRKNSAANQNLPEQWNKQASTFRPRNKQQVATPFTMPSLFKLLEKNRKWAEETAKKDPTFFPGLAAQQTPDYLWIGCSDSRVPANQITGLEPGEVFVTRNVSNIVCHSDLNILRCDLSGPSTRAPLGALLCGMAGVLSSDTSTYPPILVILTRFSSPNP